jgi:HSP20 family protein
MSGESFKRYFLSHGPRGSRPSGRLWCPAADVYRTNDGWLVKVDLAGIRPADVEISVDGPMLRISGLRRDSFCGEGVSHYQLEITYSRFEKMIQFPNSIEHAAVTRDYSDGLLILRLRVDKERAEPTRGRTRAAGNP